MFRNLVTNKVMPDFNYINCKFSFQTVFYRSSHSYCFCPCAFEHEYMDYVYKNGQINEEMYEKIAESIIIGKCPHVADVPAEHVTETVIYGIHIAAALGSQNSDVFRLSRIFRLTPYLLSDIKGIQRNLPVRSKDRSETYNNLGGCRFFSAERILKSPCSVEIEPMFTIEYCLRHGNVKAVKFLLSTIYFWRNELVSSSVLPILESQLSQIQQFLTECIIKSSFINAKTDFTELAVLFNKPDLLDQVLRKGFRIKRDIDLLRPYDLSTTCSILGRTECMHVLSK